MLIQDLLDVVLDLIDREPRDPHRTVLVSQVDNSTRLDLLFGFRIGWIIPLYKEAPEEFYLY